MLELPLQLIDKLIDLAKVNSEHKSRQFEVLRQFYSDLTTVHANYLAIFESAKSDLLAGKSELEILATFNRQRLELEALRKSVYTMSKAFLNHRKSRSPANFFELVIIYFASGSRFVDRVENGTLDNRPTLRNVIIAESFDHRFDGETPHERRRRIVRTIDISLNEIRIIWDEIGEEFAIQWASQAKL